MSQRVRSALRFLVVIVPALLIASLITLVVPNGWDIVHYGQCLLWLLVAVCSILFFCRTGGWPGLLIAIGSTAYFVAHTESLVAAYVMKRGLHLLTILCGSCGVSFSGITHLESLCCVSRLVFVVHALSDPRRLSKLSSEPPPLDREFFGVVDYELSCGGGIDRGVDARVR